MPELTQTIVLALIQGITEFLPISSSAHLLLPAILIGWDDQGIAFDVFLHGGTLVAVILFYQQVLINYALSLRRPDIGSCLDRKELRSLVIASLPIVWAGFLFSSWVEQYLRSGLIIALTTIGFGLLLGWADYQKREDSEVEERVTSSRDALIIGIAQCLALIPGTSRSGITITAGLFLGYHPIVATRFSFLLSIPIISGAILLLSIRNDWSAVSDLSTESYLIGSLLAGTTAFFTIGFFTNLAARWGMLPFVIYRIILGVILVAVIGFAGV